MKNILKKITSVILALFSCFMICNIAFANETKIESESAYLVDAKIVQIPLRNRISFRQSPKSPEGIKIELKYSDGTTVTDKIVLLEDEYYVNGENVIEAEYAAVEKYGIKKAGLYLNEGKTYLSYGYLCLPSTIIGLFQMLYEIF